MLSRKTTHPTTRRSTSSLFATIPSSRTVSLLRDTWNCGNDVSFCTLMIKRILRESKIDETGSSLTLVSSASILKLVRITDRKNYLGRSTIRSPTCWLHMEDFNKLSLIQSMAQWQDLLKIFKKFSLVWMEMIASHSSLIGLSSITSSGQVSIRQDPSGRSTIRSTSSRMSSTTSLLITALILTIVSCMRSFLKSVQSSQWLAIYAKLKASRVVVYFSTISLSSTRRDWEISRRLSSHRTRSCGSSRMTMWLPFHTLK